MDLVINIPEEDFEIMKHNVVVDNPLCPISQEKMVVIIANGTPLKDQYEARLKADMMAMLSKILAETKEEKQVTEHLHYDNLERAESYNIGIDNCIDIIQDRINKLKGREE